jgi:hypothetical protein
MFKKIIVIFEGYRTETAFDISPFTESSSDGSKGQEVYVVQELHNCPVSKYELILTNVRNSEEGISLLLYMLII